MCRFFNRSPVRTSELAALRAEVARLRAEKADLIDELATRDDALVLAEDEIDALRHALGCAEVPL